MKTDQDARLKELVRLAHLEFEGRRKKKIAVGLEGYQVFKVKKTKRQVVKKTVLPPPLPTKAKKPQLLSPEEIEVLAAVKRGGKEKLMKKYKKCTECGSKDSLTVEHIIPVVILKMFGITRSSSLNYDIHKKNLTVLCKHCNGKKGHKVDLSDKKVKRILIWYIKNHETLHERNQSKHTNRRSHPHEDTRTEAP